jgi:hypothetical protein
VIRLPAVNEPVAEIVLALVIAPDVVKFPATLAFNATVKDAPAVTFPTAETKPVLVMFPVVNPVLTMLPVETPPDTDKLLKIPTAVMLACTGLITVPAVFAKPGVTAKLASSWLSGTGLDSVPKVYGTWVIIIDLF